MQAVDKFFKTHLLGPEYFSFSAEARAKALTRANEDLKRELGHTPDAKRPGEFAALCEQTLAILLNGRTAGVAPRGRRYIRAAKSGAAVEVQECFGACRHDEDCRDCNLLTACAYITKTEPKIEQHSGMASVEELEGWQIDISVPPTLPDGEEEDNEPDEQTLDIAALVEFCRFIFSLDDYSLAILAECINPRGDARMKYTVSALAQIHGCSRQAMHRKMLASVRRHPELASVFRLVLRKIGRSRREFHLGKEA